MPLTRTRWLVAAWLLASVVAALSLARWELGRLRAAFETDARIAHRLLSQRAAQHDAVLATLGLLSPGTAADGSRPEQRLPALLPQVLAVQQRPRGAPWGDALLDAADARSRRAGHAVVARAELPAGRLLLLAHAEPASHALLLDLRALVPVEDEWPWPSGHPAPVRAELRLDGQALVLRTAAADPGFTELGFDKALSSPSQPLVLQARRVVAWAELPWVRMASAASLLGAALAAWSAWQRQAAARRRAEELLRLGQVARLNTLGELAAGMAHELNQPLTAVLANTQAAQRLLAEPEPDLPLCQQALQQAAAQAQRASQVLQRLRRSVEPADAQAPPQPLDLAAAARDALDLLAPECRQRGVALQWQDEGKPVTVAAEPVALQQIVHNLVHNALHALEQVPAAERTLTMGVTAQAPRGLLTVADSGPGIAAEALPRLFEPFFSTRAGGLGLGLPLCETLAQRMGGSLAAANRAPRGAVFTLALPLAQAA